MTDDISPGDGESVMTLQALIRARSDERGWSNAELARRSGEVINKNRWQQLATGRPPMKEYPEPSTIEAIAKALELEPATVVLAVTQSLGIDVRSRGPELAQLLPAGTDLLLPEMRNAILSIIRAAVSEALGRVDEGKIGDLAGQSGLEWSKSDAPSRRNAQARAADRRA